MSPSEGDLALRAKLYFERDIIFEISLREISKMMSLSKKYSAAEGGKRLFTQLQHNSAHSAELCFKTPCKIS